ncbi:MAG TPA: tRNA uridine-5-carboxymethylaminomethyl(34) synthesis enzyme MnmG [Phycisphaerales bacterium]|nr:tRNA uridine-5-carboxymethylaminomethyl(34) synthesis enzyme MnmG [Phycisphaerales bacterium]
MSSGCDQFDVIVIGGGHAGIEAAWAAANMGARVALVTLDPSKIGVMSCNPAIGGLAKGQMVREIDALGGLMGLATDATGIMFKVLNSSKGPAVRSPRAQCDKHAYAREAQRLIASRGNIEVIGGAVEELVVEEGLNTDHPLNTEVDRGRQSDFGRAICGVVVRCEGDARRLRARAVVLTTGTFMRGLMHTGESKTVGGRVGEAAAVGISDMLVRLGFELGRLKTGTPPRLKRGTIDWEALEPQWGDEPPSPFSEMNALSWRPPLVQVDCRVTRTTAEIHEIIRGNLHRAPMYSGQIESAGPRYCPSIEDKVVRFEERETHHVFLEPESHESDWVYCNGISTSLPRDVQDEVVRRLPGCSRAEILQYGYAVEYDMVRPHQIQATCETKLVAGLFLAGQINGTSGYEEAAGQGLIAGVNAVRLARGEALVTLGRDEAYIGVMMDDLVTKTPREPYRMFTSRAEHRLLLRSDNAADRLTARGREWGTVDEARWAAFEARRAVIATLDQLIDAARVGGERLAERVRRPRYSAEDLVRDLGLDAQERFAAAIPTVLAERQYDGYIARQHVEVRRHAEMEHRTIPASLKYDAVPGLRNEARQALMKFRPDTFGRAARLEGVSPADMTILLVAAGRR